MKYNSITIGGFLLCAGLCLAARAADDAPPLTGTWSLNNWTSGDSLRLNLAYRDPTTRWEWGSDQPLLDLHGLTGEQLHSAHASAAFTLQRDAGTFAFEGSLMVGIGRGGYRFVPDPSYAAKLRALGYEPIGTDDISIMLMATHDVSLAYASEVKFLGLRDVSVQDLVRFREHGVGPDFIRALAATGYPDLTEDDIIKLRDHGVDPEYVARIQSAGYGNLAVDQIIKLHDHGVD